MYDENRPEVNAMIQISPRLVFSALFMGCAGLLGFGYYLQYVDGLEPCNLCIFERVCFAAVALMALVGLIHGSRGKASRVYHGLGAIPALIGTGIALRHVWLQHLPPSEVPECGPGLDFLMRAFPLQDVIQTVLKGSGDCAEVVWQLLGLSIPAWAPVCFLGLLLINVAGLLGVFRYRETRR